MADPMDQRVARHLDLVTKVAEDTAAAIDEHVESARAALKTKDQKAFEAAINAIAEHPKKMRERVKQTHDAIVAGAPTAT
jgi:hypothetical protein